MKRSRMLLVIGFIGALIAGSLLLFNQIGTSQSCEGEGPCMLFFYTDW